MSLEVNLDAPCWLWTKYKTTQGYGMLRARGRTWLAHRWMWTLMRGEIPKGMDLDHLCRIRACVNPQHLEVVSHRENMLRNPLKTHCPSGHPYDKDNTYYYPGNSLHRGCRACNRRYDPVKRRERTERARLARNAAR